MPLLVNLNVPRPKVALKSTTFTLPSLHGGRALMISCVVASGRQNYSRTDIKITTSDSPTLREALS
jgi:hypothetical protein